MANNKTRWMPAYLTWLSSRGGRINHNIDITDTDTDQWYQTNTSATEYMVCFSVLTNYC